MTIQQSLQWARAQLIGSCDRPLYEGELLLAYHLGVERTFLLLHGEDEMADFGGFEVLVARRAKYEPLEYITGVVSFYDIELYIAPGALIPRSETEILVEKAAEVISENNLKLIAEIGVGSGAISISLARLFPELRIIASDISQDALAVAAKNIKNFGLESRIELRHTSLLDEIDEPIEMVVSNPPYIARGTPLGPNVADYEPHAALFSEGQGDELLREIIILTHQRGIKHLACEMGYDQRQSISKFVSSINGAQIEFYTDLAGLDRGFVINIEGKK